MIKKISKKRFDSYNIIKTRWSSNPLRIKMDKLKVKEGLIFDKVDWFYNSHPASVLNRHAKNKKFLVKTIATRKQWAILRIK